MRNSTIYATEVSYTNSKKETLSLEEIMDTRIITFVSFSYRTKKRTKKIDSWSRRMFRHEIEVQDDIDVQINSHNLDLVLSYNSELSSLTIKFSSQSEFNKILDDSFDEESLKKQYVHTLITPYHFIVPIEAIHVIEWE